MSTEPRESRVRGVAVAASLLALTGAHFTTPVHAHEIHDLLFKATFIPLILSGLWFGMRGGALCSTLVTIAYIVHLATQLHHSGAVWTWVGDIVLYNVVALTTGALSDRRTQALRQAQGHARQLQENASSLLRAEQSLRESERLRALGELAAGMAHEIRNPLGGIRGAAEVLREEATPPDARREFALLLETEVARLDRVVANFLEFARPPSARAAAVRPAEIVDAVFLLLGTDARRSRVELRNDVPPGLVARADPDLLRQLLLNLALNALQAQPGGGLVRVTGVAEQDGRVVLDVEDRGPGVPDSLRPRIFDPYVSGREGGSGLGLPIAARLAETMQGTLRLRATGAEGTTFSLALPAAS